MAPRTEQEFKEYVQEGGAVEAGDWMPDDYRAKLVKFIEMHGNSELMGVLPEREWILRAPTLQRKLALTAKVQDEDRKSTRLNSSHANISYAVFCLKKKKITQSASFVIIPIGCLTPASWR